MVSAIDLRNSLLSEAEQLELTLIQHTIPSIASKDYHSSFMRCEKEEEEPSFPPLFRTDPFFRLTHLIPHPPSLFSSRRQRKRNKEDVKSCSSLSLFPPSLLLQTFIPSQTSNLLLTSST